MKKSKDLAEVANAGSAVAAAKPDFSLIDESLLKSRIHTIRGVKVMLDADLAEIYGYSTSRFNEQVKYNIGRFDEDFRFQLKKEELSGLISEIPISKRGGTRKMPYAFTEQGVYMLMTVLRGERAIAQSKALIRLFKQMKDYIVSENLQLLSPESPQIASYTIQNIKDIADIRGELAETRADVSEMKSDLQKMMENFIDPSSFKHFLILNGQKLEADVAFDVKSAGNMFHDRYIYLDYGQDSEKLFHCGTSSKDAGGKVTTIMQIERPEAYHPLIEELGKEES